MLHDPLGVHPILSRTRCAKALTRVWLALSRNAGLATGSQAY